MARSRKERLADPLNRCFFCDGYIATPGRVLCHSCANVNGGVSKISESGRAKRGRKPTIMAFRIRPKKKEE